MKFASFPGISILTAAFLAAACAAYGQAGNSANSNGRQTDATAQDKIEVPFIAQPPLTSPMANYAGFKPSETVLPKGFVFEEGRMPFPADTIYDRDVAVKLRDGTTIYIDVYRPTGEEKVPAIICWGPAGKRGQNNMLDHMGGGDAPARMGIPKDALSGMQAWESPDPAQWVAYGYAMVNVDPRGVYMSEGDLQYFGPQDGRDGYDVIEWLAQQKWNNGKIGMNGSSWYAMTQWEIAAQQPPHLAAIAPAEGELNPYRDEYVRDGIPMPTQHFMSRSFGSGKIEDIATMIDRYPLMNSYWKSKIPDLSKINIPVYVVASYGSQTHSRGTLDAFNLLATKDKWLRVHDTQEWFDMYNNVNGRLDLKRFFDHYLKGIDNGWESTPRVRLSVLDPGGLDVVNRVEKEFPLARQAPTKLYLDASGARLTAGPVAKEDKVSYNSDEKGKTAFTVRFDKETEITGYIKLRLWVEADGASDMDLYARIVKLDKNGQPLYQDSKSHKYYGPDGRLRVSLRKLDAAKSTALQPYHTFDESQPLHPGEIVPVEIQIWPTGMLFHPGQQLQLVIAGYDYTVSNPGDRPATNPSNKGIHIIHAGGKYDSYLLVPMILNKN